jgi:hypothetical protein
MTVKDHSAGLMYLCALPCKRAAFVAAELEKFLVVSFIQKSFTPVCIPFY